jgi:ATP-dependent Clp protease ATP-binding subunit ClpX
MLDVMYKIPSIDNVTECLVTEEVILGNSEPVLKYGKSKKSA